MQCTPWHSFSQFDGRESTLPVICISSRGIDLERALNSRCAVIEVLQTSTYAVRYPRSGPASNITRNHPEFDWKGHPGKARVTRKCFKPRNRYLSTLTPRYQADPHGILTYSYCTLPASKIYCTITSQI